jgi:hypothetical protein
MHRPCPILAGVTDHKLELVPPSSQAIASPVVYEQVEAIVGPRGLILPQERLMDFREDFPGGASFWPVVNRGKGAISLNVARQPGRNQARIAVFR